MTPDYFDAEKTGGSKDSIEITLDVKTEKAMDFANEIRNAMLDKVFEVIDWRLSLLGNTVADGLIKQELDIIKTTIIKELNGE